MGFLNPNNLVYALSLALLILIYLRSRSRPTIEVSSLMLFEELPAPVASVRHVRIDLLFWLEMAALSALILAIAGLYVRVAPSPSHGRIHALVFDLGAAMSARADTESRLDQARHDALQLINRAPPGDQFTIIGYALEAQVRRPPTANLVELRDTLAQLAPMAVPARSAALRAALMRARGASEVDLFADRAPMPAILADAAGNTRVNFHKVGQGDANLAIVSLDPGIPGSTKGRIVVRNFSAHPHPCDLSLDLNNVEAFHQTLMLAPREQIVVPFEPLKNGGVIHARILNEDQIFADNSRYAFAPSERAGGVLVLSPDPSVRDDLARVLLAVDSNFRIETADPAKLRPGAASFGSELIVMHDCYVADTAGNSTLLIYPPTKLPTQAGFSVTSTLPATDLHIDSLGISSPSDSISLASTRVLALPEWLDPLAIATGAARSSSPAAALGTTTSHRVGIIAFDIRNHLLLDPDHLNALVLTVDMLRQLTAPRDTQIVSTGSYVSVPTIGAVRVVYPDGSTRVVKPDKWGRVRLRPLQSGRYSIEGALKSEVLANYYDATESDLGAKPEAASPAPAPKPSSLSTITTTSEVHPLLFILIALALLALMTETAMLIRHAAKWGMRHV